MRSQGQFIDLHVRRPRRLGKHQQGIQPRAAGVQVPFTGGKVQAQVRQVGVQAPQARNQPARQQAAGAAEDERRVGAATGQLGANVPQALEGLAAGIAQTNPGICEFNATSILDEQAQAQVLFQHFQLPAHRAMGHVQLFGSLADTVEPGSGFEGPQGIQGGQVAAHGIGEFS